MNLDYDALNSCLIEAHAGTRAAECHGFICGYFCASNTLNLEAICDHLVSGLDNAAELEQCHALVSKIAEDVVSCMQSNEVEFDLLLPEDDEEISMRTDALADWSGGFLSGIGIGGLGEKQSLSTDCNEFIQDLTNISKMKTETSEDEDVEAALFELVEYIRIGVMMLYQEWHPHTETVQRPGVLH